MTAGKSKEDELAQWVTSVGLAGRQERTDYETGSTVLARGANPNGIFAGPARLLSIQLRSGRIVSLSVYDIPLNRPISEELADIFALLGVPEHVVLEPILGGQSLGYALRLIYPSSIGLQISYYGLADQVDLSGQMQEAVCLGRSPYRKATIDLTPSLADLDYTDWDWAKALYVDEVTLVAKMLDSTQCLPLP